MDDTILEDLLDQSRRYAGDEPTAALRKASGAFLSRADSDSNILVAAANALAALPPVGAGWLALVLGTAVERGTAAAVTLPGLVQFLRSCLPQLPVPKTIENDDGEEEESYPDPTPQQETLLEALRPVGQGLVAHLARLPVERLKLSEDRELMERLEVLAGYSPGLNWVHEALLRKSGTLIVLHPPSGSGLKLRYENLARNFHLFSLLQAAVGTRIPGGRQPDPKIVAAAHGQTGDRAHDQAWWHYGDPRSKTPELRQSIWGEGQLKEIPIINGSRVMLLWPPLLQSRTWDEGFFTPHLQAMPPSVVIEEELARETAHEWLKTLGVLSGAHL
jgi:hypothetical protein